ncbi:MAG: aminotransferase class V-fold PLP-dependent enzyme [Synergistaceae bacterium]|jgi:hypothetical protein|nr:aminotransferase class V-fold PLP-dependent enzyme [Synergistaceae bacterium]
MKTTPLKSLSVDEAKAMQFRLVDAATRRFRGSETLSNGDLGVCPEAGRPRTTETVERVIADFFGVEAAALVRGAGSGAIRAAVWSVARGGDAVLVHDAPVYSTTESLFEAMGLRVLRCDFNSLSALAKIAGAEDFSFALVQHARQRPEDSYSMEEVLAVLKRCAPRTPVITDENYATLKVPAIGAQLGADLSAFSTFKLLGPEGTGCVVGKAGPIARIHGANYSGGGQVQGHEAMEVLRGMIYAPVALAIQAEVSEELLSRLKNGEVPGVADAVLANAQSKVLLIEFERPIARGVLEACDRSGAAPRPVGAESKYEFAPMFYRMSGTFLKSDPSLSERMIRVNPMRAGAETVLRILRAAMREAESR